MNFFNDIGNALNPNTNGLTNSINNTNQAAANALNPNTNGLTNSINNTNQAAANARNPNTNGFIKTLDPTQNGVASSITKNQDIQDLINNNAINQISQTTKNINDTINKLKWEFSPQNITKTINHNINPKEITKQIINDPTLNKITKPVQPTLQPIINKTLYPIVDKLPTTIQPKDVTKSGIDITNKVVSSLTPTPKPITNHTTLYLIVAGVLAGVYFLVPNKK